MVSSGGAVASAVVVVDMVAGETLKSVFVSVAVYLTVSDDATAIEVEVTSMTLVMTRGVQIGAHFSEAAQGYPH